MGKIFAQKWGIGVGLNVALAFVSRIIGMFTQLSGITAAIVIGVILGAIAGSVAVGIYCKFIDLYEIPGSNSYWGSMLMKNKPIKFYKVLLALLPNLLCSAIFITTLCIFYNHAGIEFPIDLSCVILTLLGSGSTFWFIYWFGFAIHYLRATCLKCGNVKCKISIGRENYNSYSYTDTKTKTYYGTIGTVYLGDKAVGDIKGNKGSTTYTRKVRNSSWTTKCKCYYCGRNTKLHEFDSFEGDWNQQ